MPMPRTERGRLGGLAWSARATPEEKKAASRRAYLAGAVKAVVNRAPELTPEQAAQLRAVFGGR